MNTLLQILCLFTAQLMSRETQAKVPAVIVFGDSTLDSGNNNHIATILKSNFEPYGRDFIGGPTGRFSNGRVPSDFISELFGLKPIVPAYLDPAYNISHFATGVCFASAGTGYDTATSDVLSVISLTKELEYYKEYQKKLRVYLGDIKANETIADALNIVSMGTNDFLENYYTIPGRRDQYDVDRYQEFLVGIARNFVKELYVSGARKVSLGGLPPMGCLPLERTVNFLNGNECNQMYNVVAVDFNRRLSRLVNSLKEEFPGIKIVFSNPYNILMKIIRHPSLYGFEVASLACCATGTFEMGYACNKNNQFTCADANKYVFWDAFHPTEKTNRIIAEHILKARLAHFL